MVVWIWLGPLLVGLISGMLFGLRPTLMLLGVVLAIELGYFLFAQSPQDFGVAWLSVIALTALPIYGGAMLLGAVLGAYLRSAWRDPAESREDPPAGRPGTD
jgi:hypothetical protein